MGEGGGREGRGEMVNKVQKLLQNNNDNNDKRAHSCGTNLRLTVAETRHAHRRQGQGDRTELSDTPLTRGSFLTSPLQLTEGTKGTSRSPRTGFSASALLAAWADSSLLGGCPGHGRMSGSFLGFYSVDVVASPLL